jgi:hypothetical protein
VSQAGTTGHRRWIRAAVLAGITVIVAGSAILAPPALAQQPVNDHSVRVDVLSVTPSTPAQSNAPVALTVVLSLTNTTDQSLDSITVSGERGNPISTQQALDDAIKNPQAADRSVVGSFEAKKPVTSSLGPQASAVVEYRASSEIPLDEGLCICHDAIYPLYFTVHSTAPDGSDQTIGFGQTYVPAFKDTPQPVQVSWIWPIIDRPHRLVSDTVFIDDELAYSIAGGRLDRILKVVEDVGKLVPMTLVIDPELIDELAVMSEGTYEVETAAGKTTPGTGSQAATTWLQRLRAVLTANPQLEVHFTPFADPDVESLTRNGLSWTNSFSQLAQDRVTTALGRTATTDLAWPADETISEDALNAVVRQGAKSIILSDAALPGGAKLSPTPNALASLQTAAGPVSAVVSSRTIQRYVAQVLSVGAKGLADLPQLVAEVAIRAVEDGSVPHYVAIVAPRNLDPNPAVAARALLDTAHTLWSTGLGAATAVSGAVPPADYGQLAPPRSGTAVLSPTTISAGQRLSELIPALSTMLASADASNLLGALPAALQRAESSFWRTDMLAGDAFARRLDKSIDSIQSGVEIVRPSTGTYTLASSNSPLPITIHNKLAVPVTVRLRVTPTNRLPGFTATDLGEQTIPAGQNVTLHIPTHVERTGRFLVEAVLMTPNGVDLGKPVFLSVHSTALGAIGVIITVVAGAVLALALLVRFVRRWRGRPNKPADAEPAMDPVAAP